MHPFPHDVCTRSRAKLNKYEPITVQLDMFSSYDHPPSSSHLPTYEGVEYHPAAEGLPLWYRWKPL